ncbi:MAG: metal ABC transporter permease [Rhizonema sp. PD38]|nr:metal ABC transporter permease [Rhizonema sp. PD38]
MLASDVQLSWNLVSDFQQLFAYHFMQNAFTVGMLIALIAGSVGYFMVLRFQSFAGHTLAHVGFAGAAGALLFGGSAIVGLLVSCIGAALGIGLLGGRRVQTSWAHGIGIGTIQTFSMGLGILFLQLSHSYTENIYAILFGSVLGISDIDVHLIVLTTVVTLAGLIAIARPLLFASIDPDVADARGVPVRFLDYAFLILLAFAVAQSVQVVGVLLIFGLLVTPAAIAQQLTSRPGIAVGLSIFLALFFTWAGLAIAYFTPYPVGFFITGLAFGTYILVRLFQVGRAMFDRRRLSKRQGVFG